MLTYDKYESCESFLIRKNNNNNDLTLVKTYKQTQRSNITTQTPHPECLSWGETAVEVEKLPDIFHICFLFY